MINETNDLRPFLTTNENAPAYWMFDILWVIKATGKQTGGQLTMIEQTMPYGSGPLPHMHPDMEEMFYVIEGELTIWINGEISVFKEGTFGLIPRRAVHYFKITSKENCRALNIYTPSGFEEGIMRNAQKAERLTLPPKGLGVKSQDDMHVSIDIEPVDLMRIIKKDTN